MATLTSYAVFARNCSSIGALTFVLSEGVANWDLEYKYITRAPPSSVKWLFLYSRYFGIAAQVLNCILIGRTLSQLPIRAEDCRVWYGFQVIVGRSLLAALEIVLSLRVHVLYGRSFKMGLSLVAIVLVGVTTSLIYGVSSVLDMKYDADCRGRGSPRGPFCVSLSILITHILLWTLTITRGGNSVYNRWREHHVIHAVVCDGTWIMFLMFSISVSIVPYIFLDHLVATNIVFSWPMALISTFCCRLILKMHSVRSSTQ